MGWKTKEDARKYYREWLKRDNNRQKRTDYERARRKAKREKG